MCSIGGTFRDAFSSWSAKTWSTTSHFHRLGELLVPNRPRGNDAFAPFLMTLQFQNDEDVRTLFSCSKCKRDVGDGAKQMYSIVMDVTAMGIRDITKIRQD